MTDGVISRRGPHGQTPPGYGPPVCPRATNSAATHQRHPKLAVPNAAIPTIAGAPKNRRTQFAQFQQARPSLRTFGFPTRSRAATDCGLTERAWPDRIRMRQRRYSTSRTWSDVVASGVDECGPPELS